MMIAVDLGNTSTVIGVLEGTKVKRFWRIMTQERTSDEYSMVLASLIARDRVSRGRLQIAGICSVVPSETGPVADAFRADLGIPVKVFDGAGDWGIRIRTDNPAEVGADRIANAVAAFYEYGGPAIVVDIGTATTYDCISARGEYLGGVIAPGMLAGAKDLWRKARMLPAVEIKQPPKVIGTTTVGCMQSGILYGNVGQVEGVVRRIWKEMGGQCRVILTGGWGGSISAHLGFSNVFDPSLTLKGIAYGIEPGLRRGSSRNPRTSRTSRKVRKVRKTRTRRRA
jgi:type III pantothenate kinase